MRKLNLLVTLAVLFVTFSSFAQNKNGFKYQTIIRDNTNKILENKPVSFRMSMLKGSTTGIPVYRETFNATTNTNGLITLEIGNGTTIFGSFDAILWYDDNYFLRVEFDPNGGTNYQLMGVSQLLAVPYAYVSLWTQKAINDMDTSPTNEIQTLDLKGHNLSISQGNTINLPIGDTSNTNEIQMISFSNDTLFLSNGGFVNLGKFNNTVALNSIKARIASDSLFLKSLIDTNTAHLNTEKNSRISGDQILNTAISNEAALRTNSIALITNNINTLVTKQIADSTVLQNNINTFTTNMANEVTDRQTADNGIYTKINADSSFLKYRVDSSLTKIANEISARVASEGSIYIKIKSDSTYFKGMIDNNTTDISNNTTAISNNTIAISNNTSAISNNLIATMNNTTAISNNTTAINNEITDRQAAINTVNTRITTDSTYLKGLIDLNSVSINNEITARQIADNGTYTKIATDSTYLKGLIDLNSVSINNEIAARQIADNGTYTKIATDSTYLNGLIDVNTTSINNEITAREAADNSIYTKIFNDSNTLNGYINTNSNDIATINTNLSTDYYTKANVQTSGNALIHWDNLTNKPTTLSGYGITDAVPISHVGSNGTSHDTSNMTSAGFMSMNDKIKLDAITGINTGNQTITLTGNVTGSGTGTFAATITNNAVTSNKILNGTIATIDLADSLITSVKIYDGTIATVDLSDGLITTAKIADANVTTAKIAANSVDGTKIQLGSDANGDILYYNGTDYIRLPVGTNGQVLVVNGTVPGWVTKHSVGESYGGGIIFYVDATGQHGLIATAGDISAGNVWSDVSATAIGAPAKSFSDGDSNSSAIVLQTGHTTSAAKVCLDYSNTVSSIFYDDWYLPAAYQLNILYTHAYEVGSFSSAGFYWSSTEATATNAYRQSFATGAQSSSVKTGSHRVRCIRSF